jgi:hypothetical protein
VGAFHGGNFQAIQEYFQQRFCRFCANPFSSEGIQLLREEPGVLVVRVTCKSCGQPLGVAIVGTSARHQSKSSSCPLDWTRKDVERLSGNPAISYDDVLNAHEFVTNLGADWAKHLPKIKKSQKSA